MHWKKSAKWQPFCLSLNVLITMKIEVTQVHIGNIIHQHAMVQLFYKLGRWTLKHCHANRLSATYYVLNSLAPKSLNGNLH